MINPYVFLGSLVCPPCEDVCEGKPPSLTSSAKTLSGHGGVADRYRRVTICLIKRYYVVDYSVNWIIYGK